MSTTTAATYSRTVDFTSERLFEKDKFEWKDGEFIGSKISVLGDS